MALITLGHDPAGEKKAEKLEITFNELFDIYYHQHCLKNIKDPKANKRMMDVHILPVFGKSKVKNITREQLCKIHAHMGVYSGHGGANRVIGIVSAIFNFGIREGYYRGVNPCAGIKRFPSYSRDRFLSLDELRSFFDAVEHEDEQFKDFFLLLLFTGARKSNVLSMQWAHVDLSLKRWRLPEAQTKNKDVNIIQLSHITLEILVRRKGKNVKLENLSPYVFPGIGKAGYLKDPKKAFERIRERMEVFDIRIHDLRRTLASYMAISGASLPIIGKALNHKSQDSTAIYARLSQDPVKDAVNKAVNIMLGKSIEPLFKENIKLCKAALLGSGSIRFSELLTA